MILSYKTKIATPRLCSRFFTRHFLKFFFREMEKGWERYLPGWVEMYVLSHGGII